MSHATGAQRSDLAWVAAFGIAFWFFVGFPFGNHNESYQWLARFGQVDSWRVWTTTVVAATFRPLGQGLAYLNWQLFGDSSWPVQLLNFTVAAVALSWTTMRLGESRTYAAAMALAGAAYFAGYIYLFHVHGIFYSPILGLFPLLLYSEQVDASGVTRTHLWPFSYAIAVGLLFHPYALILYAAYLVGYAGIRWKTASRTAWFIWMGQIVVLLATIAALRPVGHRMLPFRIAQGFLTSYSMTEVSPVLTLVSACFLIATLVSITRLSRKRRLQLAVGATAAVVILAGTDIPVILLWIVAAVWKFALCRQWGFATMTAAAMLLPGIAPSGSPTYAVFAIVLSVIATASGWTSMERTLARIDRRWAVTAVVVFSLVAVMVRTGVIHMPIISRLAQPLLAEREKTEQLESIIAWLRSSPHKGSRLVLETAVNPVDDVQRAMDRRRRPPTYQQYLDEYLASQGNMGDAAPALLVTFGGHQRPEMVLLTSVPGRFAGPALVYRN